MKEKVLIVGFGVVGNNLYEEIKKLEPHIYDKYKPEVNTYDSNVKYDLAFICVDTPMLEDGSCDLTELKNAVHDTNADTIVIKSTVEVGTTRKLSEELKGKKRVLFSPEYYGGTQHNNNFNFAFTILGGDKHEAGDVVQILQRVYDGRHEFHIVDFEEAEIVKYMENAFLGTKVMFVNQFYDICKTYGASYEQVRELFVLDPRIHPSHTFVYKNAPYYDTHCLNKDIPAIIQSAKKSGTNVKFLEDMHNYNLERKKKYKK